MENLLPNNPFSDDYWKAELKAYGLRKKAYKAGNVRIRWTCIYGRCDDYLNVNIRFEKKVPLPQLIIDDDLWMSLTPMEIQSSALAIHRATGHVICGGLGLGYFALRAAAKPEVTQVTVFENQRNVIAWFKHVFKKRPELAKITFVEGDMRQTCKGYKADFAFVDIYPDLLCDTTFTDAKLFRRQNDIARYMFWGYERVIVSLVVRKMLKHGALLFGNDLRSYIKHWQTTPFGDNPDDGVLASYFRERDMPDASLLRQGRRVITDFPL